MNRDWKTHIEDAVWAFVGGVLMVVISLKIGGVW